MRKGLRKALASTLSLTLAVTSFGFVSVNLSEKVDAAPTTSSKLVWSDEFNGSSLDTSKWGYEIGTGGSGWGNNELQYYTNRKDNCYVSGGALHIKAKRESYNGMNYTSARINTSNKFSFKYGYVEARIAVPRNQGIWPAFWMLGQNIGSVGWPKCGEIDIMEAINTENKTYGTCHWDSNGHAEYGKSTGNFDITQYHKYAVQWDSQFIRFFMDGSKFYEMNITNNTGNTEEFHKPFYMILNVAVGGNWPGFSINDAGMPQEMKVDYIRVYQETASYTSSSSNNVDKNTGSSSSGSSSSGSSSSGSSSSGSTSTPSSGMGMSSTGSSTAQAYVNGTKWADIHYKIDGGTQQNVRMSQSGTKSTYTISGLSSGKKVTYWFTYADTNGVAKDSASYTYTHGSSSSSSSGSSSSGSSSSGSSGSVNTTTGDIYIYADGSYKGKSASLGVGSYNLASLQKKGIANDSLSSIKCPWGYKVTLYADDNYKGSKKTLYADWATFDSSWNDKVSSIKVERAIYKIVNRNSGLCLDVKDGSTAAGANVQQWTDNGTKAQQWKVVFNKEDSTYYVISVLNSKPIVVDSYSKSNGGNCIIYNNDYGTNKRWYITSVDNGYSFFINKNSNKGLEVAGSSKSAGGNVQQWDYKAQANQQWKFVRVN